MNRKSGNRRHENSIKEKEDNRERGIRRENNEKEIRNTYSKHESSTTWKEDNKETKEVENETKQ